MIGSARDPLDLRQEHGVETPEHVEMRLELAGIGSRSAAMFLDIVILLVVSVGLAILYSVTALWHAAGGGAGASWALALIIFTYSFVILAYFGLFEALNGGRTPGKQILGIRVVMDTGRPITASGALVRTLIRLLDCLTLPILAFVSIWVSKSNKRLGDMAAGTIVIRDRPTDWVLGAVAGPELPDDPIDAGPPELSEDEFRLLDRFLSRLADLDRAVQARMTAELVRRFETRVPRREPDGQAYLVQLFAEEQRRRRSRFATRAQPGAAVGRTTVTAERFVARKRAQWEAFYAVAQRVERGGVGGLNPGEIPAFAAHYREVAADLARARTYKVDPRVVAYLERLVSAGHNALYRVRGRQRTPVARYVLRDFPAAVVESRAYVIAAFLFFAVPGIAGYVMLRERPELADEIVSPVMVSRAEQAAARQAEGVGYAQSNGEDLPVIAAAIISNNVRVAFGTLVGGMLAGTLTVWLLVLNGMMLGTGMGVFENHGALPYLMTFIAGHGVLELTAIFISGGAGLRLAKALIAPGDRTRRDALVVEGIVAARMTGAVVTLLVIAGTIEGLLSASDAAAGWKYGVSATTVLLLALYLYSGKRFLARGGGERAPTARRP